MADRVAELEAELESIRGRQWKADAAIVGAGLALLLGAVALVLALNRPEPEPFRMPESAAFRSVGVLDDAGRPVASLFADSDGVHFVLSDASGKPRMTQEVDRRGWPLSSWKDANGRNRVVIGGGTGSDEDNGVGVFAPNGALAVDLSASYRGFPLFTMFHPDDPNQSIQMGYVPEGPFLQAHDGSEAPKPVRPRP